ncbi:MAG: hypothetical protein LBU76_02920 [Azoarcus sp.]|jgi:hypothetical protein|nr:hypothetical protein [Azoarcus sp.]
MSIHLNRKFLLCGVFFFVLSACMPTGELNNKSSAFKQSLAAVDGHFNWRSKSNTHDYSKWQELRSVVLAQSPSTQRNNLPENVLAELVDCFDDPSPSASTFRNNSAPLGWVCYAALTGFVYHEETNKEGDIVQHWDGYPIFPASPQNMKAAKAAWQKVIIEKTYLFP